MAKVTLDDFIKSEMENLMKFAAAWRECNDKKPEMYPNDHSNKYAWYKQYLAFTARRLDEEGSKAA